MKRLVNKQVITKDGRRGLVLYGYTTGFGGRKLCIEIDGVKEFEFYAESFIYDKSTKTYREI